MKIFKAEPLHRYQCHDSYLGFVDRILTKREQELPGLYQGMFNEDFTRLFHLRSRRNRNLFEVVSNDDDLVQKLLSNVSTRYVVHAVGEAILELVTEIAQSLVCFGNAYFYVHDDTEQGNIHLNHSAQVVFLIFSELSFNGSLRDEIGSGIKMIRFFLEKYGFWTQLKYYVSKCQYQ